MMGKRGRNLKVTNRRLLKDQVEERGLLGMSIELRDSLVGRDWLFGI